MHELSVVFLTYNARFEDVRDSLESVICQKDVDLEIVVADDGSKDNLQAKMETFFKDNDFADYKLVMNPRNAGTVANLLSGLEAADGEYIKTLSPGDRLYSEHTLREWLDFLRAQGSAWSFSDVIYYYKDSEGSEIRFKEAVHPQDVSPYIMGDLKRCRWNYVVLNDIPIGAAILSKTAVQMKYCKRIKEAGVKYAEDNMWRLMMFDGELGTYYPSQTVLYETGTGISSPGSDLWKQRLARDWSITDDEMRKTANPDEFQQSMLKGIKTNASMFEKMLIKGKISLAIKRRFRKRMNQCR